MILVIDFGSQYTELLARQIRKLKVFSEIVCWDDEKLLDELDKYEGLIISGSPDCAKDELHEKIFKDILEKFKKPILAICYGMQVMHKINGGELDYENCSELGDKKVEIIKPHDLLDGIPLCFNTWMSHNDSVIKPGVGSEVIGKTDKCISITADDKKKIYALQFHPEVEHSNFGTRILKNFLSLICRIKPNWEMEELIEKKINYIRKTAGRKFIYLALSGGLDSSVTAELIKRSQVKFKFIYIETGFNRDSQINPTLDYFAREHSQCIKKIYAEDIFLKNLKGVELPEEKRSIIGETFVKVLKDEIEKMSEETDYFLAQGTIHSDLIESGKKNKSHTIKTHHNTVSSITENFKLLEPINDLFKSEVRSIAKQLELPDFITSSHPFPGPGYAIRIIGEITKEKLKIIKIADRIVIEVLMSFGLYKMVSQAFAVLLNTKTVGVEGDKRTYGHVIAIRAINTTDFMTAQVSNIPLEVLSEISKEIINTIPEVSRVVYDVTSKPPAAIEWE